MLTNDAGAPILYVKGILGDCHELNKATDST